MKISQSTLHRIISESIRETLNEISPELKARATVKANHNWQQLNRSNNDVEKNLNGVPVHKDTQKRRRERQILAFKKGLENDMRRKFGKDTTFGIRNSGDDDSNEFSADYNGNTFRHYSSTDGGSRGSLFSKMDGDVKHRDMRASEYLTNMVDAMAGYDSELKGDSPFNSRLGYVNDRAKDVENTNRYNKEKEEYDRRKEESDRKMSEYERLPWYKKPFSKRPLPFTDEKPMKPKLKTGPYFTPNEPESVYKRGEEIKGNHNANKNAYSKFLKKH